MHKTSLGLSVITDQVSPSNLSFDLVGASKKIKSMCVFYTSNYSSALVKLYKQGNQAMLNIYC